MAEILPSTIAGARAGGRVQGGNPMLPVISADIASQASTNLARVAGDFIGVAAEYSARQVALAKQEQQVLATQQHNIISAKLNQFINDAAQSDDPDWTNLDSKIDEYSAELYSNASKNLSPYAQKRLKDSMIINEQIYKNNAQAYRMRQLEANKKAGAVLTLDNAKNTAVNAADLELALPQLVNALSSSASVNGLKDTKESLNRYRKGQKTDTSDKQTLDEQLKTAKEELGKTKLGTNEYAEKKTLVDTIQSVKNRETYIQAGVDSMYLARADRFIKAGDYASLKTLVDNVSNGEVSSGALAKMKSVYSQYEEINIAESNVKVIIGQVYPAGINPLKESTADRDKRILEGEIKAGKVSKNPKINEKSIKYYKNIVAVQERAYEISKNQYMSKSMDVFSNLNQAERSSYLDKERPGLSSENYAELQKILITYNQREISDPNEIENQYEINYTAVNAARDGYWVDKKGNRYDIKSEKDFINYFRSIDGMVNSPSARDKLAKQYATRNEVIDMNSFINASRYYNQSPDKLIKKGVPFELVKGGYLPPLDTKIGKYSKEQINKAMGNYLNDHLTPSYIWGAIGGNIDKTLSHDSMIKSYMLTHDNNMPNNKQLEEYADSRNMVLNGNVYKPKTGKIDQSLFFPNFSANRKYNKAAK